VGGAVNAGRRTMIGALARAAHRVGARAIGPNIFHVGPVGPATRWKAINNMMACVKLLAMMEGWARREAGLDPMTIYRGW